MSYRAYVVLSIDQLRKIVRGATKKAKQQPSGRTLDRCVVIESVVTRMPSSEALQLNSTKLTARMAGDAFTFYPGDKP